MTVGEIMDKIFYINAIHAKLSAQAETDNPLAELCGEASELLEDYGRLLRGLKIKKEEV